MQNIKMKAKQLNIKALLLFKENKKVLRKDAEYHFEQENVSNKELWKDLYEISNYSKYYKYQVYTGRTQTIEQRKL